MVQSMAAAIATDLLLEREALLETLAASFGAARRGSGRLALVSGEAGAGKTSLVRRFCEELPRGTTVLPGACDPLITPRPLGPFLEIGERSDPPIVGAKIGRAHV